MERFKVSIGSSDQSTERNSSPIRAENCQRITSKGAKVLVIHKRAKARKPVLAKTNCLIAADAFSSDTVMAVVGSGFLLSSSIIYALDNTTHGVFASVPIVSWLLGFSGMLLLYLSWQQK